MAASPTLIPAAERIEALDVLRGSAALGILLMNVRLFAEPASLYFNPTALGPPMRVEYVIWSSTYLLADLKFLTIFALLFGAGIVLMSERIAAHGAKPGPVHYRRMGWLLVFGLVHAYVLWDGDILVPYAVCGALAFPARRLTPPVLLTLAAVIFAVGSVLTLGLGALLESAPPEVLLQWAEDFWRPSPAQVADEIRTFQSGWLTQLPWRAERGLEYHGVDMWLHDVWRVTGLMLAGMGLFRLGVLSGVRSRRFYGLLALIGFAAGLPVVWWGLQQSRASGWDLRDAYFVASQWNYWGCRAGCARLDRADLVRLPNRCAPVAADATGRRRADGVHFVHRGDDPLHEHLLRHWTRPVRPRRADRAARYCRGDLGRSARVRTMVARALRHRSARMVMAPANVWFSIMRDGHGWLECRERREQFRGQPRLAEAYA